MSQDINNNNNYNLKRMKQKVFIGYRASSGQEKQKVKSHNIENLMERILYTHK